MAILGTGGGAFLWLGSGTANVSVGRAGDHRTAFRIGAALIFFDLPPSGWEAREASVGGHVRATGGLPASYIVRRDRLIDLTLRIRESEWLDFLNALVLMQSGDPFEWFPRVGDPAPAWVTLWAPIPGTPFAPQRMPDYPRVFEATITLRGDGTSNPWTPFFEVE